MFAYLSDLFDEPIAAQPEVKSIEDIIEALISEAPGTEEKPAEEITTEEVPTAQSTESFIPTTPPPMATTETTSPPVQTQAQPLDLMQVPDFLGGYLPTPTGYYKYLEEKMKEDQRKQIDLSVNTVNVSPETKAATLGTLKRAGRGQRKLRKE